MQILNLFTFKGNTKKRLLIWMWVTRLTKLLGKSEIPAAILKYCFSGSLFIWDRRVTPRRHLGKKSRDLGYIGELTIGQHFFLGYSARRDEILLKAHAFCMNKRKWRKLVLNPEERNVERNEKKHFRWSHDEMHSSLIECLTNYKVSCEFTNCLIQLQTFLKRT